MKICAGAKAEKPKLLLKDVKAGQVFRYSYGIAAGYDAYYMRTHGRADTVNLSNGFACELTVDLDAEVILVDACLTIYGDLP